MKKKIDMFCAAVLIGALCAGFASCKDNVPLPQKEGQEQPASETKPKEEAEPEPDTYVEKYYSVFNNLESDIVVELSTGNKDMTTIPSGEVRQIHVMKYSYPSDIAVDVGAEVLWAKMRIDGELMPAFIWWRLYWDIVCEESDPYHKSFVYTLNVNNELLERLGLETELVSIISEYKVVNLTNSDIVVNVKFYDHKETTIKPGNTGLIHDRHFAQWRNSVDLNPDISNAQRMLYAEMKIDGELVPETIWQGKYWTIDVDAKNYNFTRTLTITEDILKTIFSPQN